eukprot:6947962-Prymnesium_polylepis.1
MSTCRQEGTRRAEGGGGELVGIRHGDLARGGAARYGGGGDGGGKHGSTSGCVLSSALRPRGESGCAAIVGVLRLWVC